MKLDKAKIKEAQLVIVAGLLVISYIFNLVVLIKIATVLGLIFVFIPFLGNWVVWFWFKLAEVLGYVNSRILLSVIFFLMLTPLAFMARFFSKDPLKLKKKSDNSVYRERNYKYKKRDLENPW
ncbi:MAG: SxtJ family membrane protein [Bacteroidota bacterium]